MNGVNGANGSGGQSPQVQISPTEAAQYALMFLGRANFNRQERQAFDVAEALLTAIVQGQVVVSTPQPQPQPTGETIAPAASN